MKYFLGIDLGGTNLVVGLVDEKYKLLDKDSVSTRAGGTSDELITDMRSLADRILLRNKLKLSDIESVGVGVPGTANWDTGRIEFANNLAFSDEPFLPVITAAFEGTRVFFDNDANAAAWGEYLAGSAKGSDSMVMITLGTGVAAVSFWVGKSTRVSIMQQVSWDIWLLKQTENTVTAAAEGVLKFMHLQLHSLNRPEKQ